MHFTLYYDGPLPSAANDTRVREKQVIRDALYPQFLILWNTHPAFPPAPKEGSWSNWPEWQWSGGLIFPWWEKKSVFPRQCKSGEVKFVPLVRCEDKEEPYNSLFMLCELDVLFLRPGRRGGIIKGGDVDNRILTLSDALCVPKKEQFEKLTVAHNLNDPFFCLLEDDSLISSWSVRTAIAQFLQTNLR